MHLLCIILINQKQIRFKKYNYNFENQREFIYMYFSKLSKNIIVIALKNFKKICLV